MVLLWVTPSPGEVKILVEHHPNDGATPAFRFKGIPPVRKTDAAARAVFTLVDGQRDANGGGLEQLHDGRLPAEDDQPAANFFFQAGTDGGRILLDLGASKELKQVNTYSWHGGTRGPQVYTIYSATGTADGFKSDPKRDVDPLKCGWNLLAKVDTRKPNVEPGGQYGVSIQDSSGPLGSWRYLLFDINRTESEDSFGNTFYSEIDVVDSSSPKEPAIGDTASEPIVDTVQTGDYTITIDTTETPDLTPWVREKVVPMSREWYPKLVQMFPSEGFSAPRNVRIEFSQEMRGVAATGGTRVRCAAGWFRNNLQGEALGAVFHELVHVVQQYGRVRPRGEGMTRPPGWLVEGIADYTRWYKFEPQSGGAEISSRNLARARYDGNYRISANFLNWVSTTYQQDLVPALNTAIREGRYGESLWKDRTGKTLQELGDEWKLALEKKLNPGGGVASDLSAAIDRCRKGTITIEAPPGTEVTVEQQRHEFWFGAALANQAFGDRMPPQDREKYLATFLTNFNSAVTENALKWHDMESMRGIINYRTVDAILAWTDEHDIPLRGHNIFWGIPDRVQPWLKEMPDNELSEALKARALDIGRRYKGRFAEYDLNNEMIHGNYYEQRLGTNITREMVQWVREGDANAVLYLNDYDILTGRRLDDYLSQIRSLLGQGVPIGGIGVQGHLHGDMFDRQALHNALQKLSEFKLPIRVTEFNFPGQRSKYYQQRGARLSEEEEKAKAEAITEYYRICFAYPQVKGILMWGFWEGANWIPVSSLYRRDWTPLPAAQAYQDLVFREWWTKWQGKTDSSGKCEVRAYYGRHKVKAGDKEVVVDLRSRDGIKPVSLK